MGGIPEIAKDAKDIGVTPPMFSEDYGLGSSTLQSGKIVTAPTDAQCFITSCPASGIVDDNEYAPNNFTNIKEDGIFMWNFMVQRQSTGIFRTTEAYDFYKVRLSTPLALEDRDGQCIGVEVKGVKDRFKIMTLIECDTPTVCLCNCNDDGCNSCCAKLQSDTHRNYEALCLGTVGFCDCEAGSCSCDNTLKIDPAWNITAIYAAACAPTTAPEPYYTHVLIQGYNCCSSMAMKAPAPR